MQLLTELDNYITNNDYPTWYKYSDNCSGIHPPTNGRPVISAKNLIDDISDCIKNNKYPMYYKYTSCSGVITPDMSVGITTVSISPAIVDVDMVNNEPTPDGITLDINPQSDSSVEIYHVPNEIYHVSDEIYHTYKTNTYKLPTSEDKLNTNDDKDTMYFLDRVEYSSYSNSTKVKIINMIKKVYRYNDDKYKLACKYILSKFSHDDNVDPIASLNKLLDEKNIYKSSEFDYNPILRLTHVKNIDNILTIDDMRKIFTILY